MVIGSDWVWFLRESDLDLSPQDLSPFAKVCFGFLPIQLQNNQKRITYAASQGLIPTRSSNLINEACKRFSALSFREQATVDYINHTIGKDNNKKLSVVLDPSLLLMESDLKEIIPPLHQVKKYIAVYCLSTNQKQKIKNYILSIREKLQCEILILNTKKEFCIEGIKTIGEKLGPAEWLAYLVNSEYVITNSFHGMAFSIIMHKQFTAFERKENDIRQNDIALKLNLSHRLIKTDQAIDDKTKIDPFYKQIDWEKVDFSRSKLIKNSLEYLHKSI